MFDTFSVLSALLYRKAHNPTKERISQKGPALFCCQGKMPEAGEEVINLLRTTERKVQYQEYDLKTEQTVINQENQTITTIPSREGSFERLAEHSAVNRVVVGSSPTWGVM